MEKLNRIPIFFSSDNNYAPYLTVAIESIKEYANKNNFYDIIVLSENFSKDNALKVKAQETDNLKINFYDISKKLEGIKNELAVTLRDYYTVSIFYRMFIAEVFSNIDKALYIDADIVLNTDIAKLYFTEIGDNLVGAVSDQVVNTNEIFIKYTTEVIGIRKGEYFNSGVLLMNLKKFREEKIEEKFIKMLLKYNFPTVAPDQDYLNYFCRDKVTFLDEGWNIMPSVSGGYQGEIKLIHFNMYAKPWLYKNVTMEEYFWKHAKNTAYYDYLISKRADYDAVHRQADMSAGERLLKTATKITNDKNAFMHVLKG